MDVAAFQTESKLVGHHLAYKRSASSERLFNNRSRDDRRCLLCKPAGIAPSGARTRHIDQILDRKRAAIEHAAPGCFPPAVTMPNERTEIACAHDAWF
jgi:hypothetical protein